MTTPVSLQAAVINPAVPNMPLAPLAYEARYHDQLNNVFRLYFNRIQSSQQQIIDEVAATQALVWISNSGGMFSG